MLHESDTKRSDKYEKDHQALARHVEMRDNY